MLINKIYLFFYWSIKMSFKILLMNKNLKIWEPPNVDQQNLKWKFCWSTKFWPHILLSGKRVKVFTAHSVLCVCPTGPGGRCSWRSTNSQEQWKHCTRTQHCCYWLLCCLVGHFLHIHFCGGLVVLNRNLPIVHALHEVTWYNFYIYFDNRINTFCACLRL